MVQSYEGKMLQKEHLKIKVLVIPEKSESTWWMTSHAVQQHCVRCEKCKKKKYYTCGFQTALV